MKKLENILAENMHRFGTKNLSEAPNFNDLENTLGFDSGANRDPKTGNLIAPDGDQNNDGYPDATAGNSPDVETFKTRDDIIKALVSEFGMKRESFYNNARTQQPEKFWTFNRLFHYYWDRKRGNK